jgi:CheY-like chemotaxis protein
MTKKVLVLEDDAGYEHLIQNLLEGRGWAFRIGATYDELAGSADWADVAVIDLDAATGPEGLERLRASGHIMPVIAISGDATATAESLGVDAVVAALPGSLVNDIAAVTAPPPNVIDLTKVERDTGNRPWYATS